MYTSPMDAFRSRVQRVVPVFSLGALCVPLYAHALTLTEIRETTALFLYGMVGFFGGLACELFGGGLMVYLARLGTEHRVEGISVMIWGVQVLCGVVCLLVILTFID